MKRPTHIECIKVTGHPTDAFVLWRLQSQYKKAKAKRLGRLWYVERQEDIADSIPGLSLKQVRASLKRMKEAGHIEAIRGKSPYSDIQNAYWYRLSDDCQKALWDETLPECPPESSAVDDKKQPPLIEEFEAAWHKIMGRKTIIPWNTKQREAAAQIIEKVNSDKDKLNALLDLANSHWGSYASHIHEHTTLKDVPASPNIFTLRSFLQEAFDCIEKLEQH